MRSLLWIGDAACPSGFARATHEILDVLRYTWDVTVLGVNYRGDPHPYPYPIYCAAVEGDSLGSLRIPFMMNRAKPDLVIIQNDPWNIPFYLRVLKGIEEYKNIPVIGIVAIDGKNCLGGKKLNELTHCIFWTKFAEVEARRGGYEGTSSVIPLGVDIDTYKPMNKMDARRIRHLSKFSADDFIVGNVNRNQPRKRFDLTIRYFAEWIRQAKVDNAYLFLHVAPTGDHGINVYQLANYYGIFPKLIVMQPETHYGVSEPDMVATYNSFDVGINTGQGEGFGLTTIEAMACGVPCIAGDWSALGEWAKGAIWLVPCTSTAVGEPYENVIGGIPDEDKFIKALHTLYTNPAIRKQNSEAALERAREPRFRWQNIGEVYAEEIDKVLTAPKVVPEVVTA